MVRKDQHLSLDSKKLLCPAEYNIPLPRDVIGHWDGTCAENKWSTDSFPLSVIRQGQYKNYQNMTFQQRS